MAGRGGWGRGGGFQRYVPPVPFVLFPEDINLPDAKPAEIDRYTMKLLKWDNQFNSYFKAAAYYLEEKEEVKGRKRMHVETYSDKKKKKNFTRDSLSQVLHFEGFAKELIPGKKMWRSRKKMRWNPEADMTQKKFFEELEKKLKVSLRKRVNIKAKKKEKKKVKTKMKMKRRIRSPREILMMVTIIRMIMLMMMKTIIMMLNLVMMKISCKLSIWRMIVYSSLFQGL
ncbi:unnamed protein product [Trifolium pratense]|uniref:Uncharacterized protein n=1 Tax=Trifolium pratense TaxID=57577 RepID=A0ACB0LYH7_TRIPR|nr:unnamed protein product [Trifolium pratense]